MLQRNFLFLCDFNEALHDERMVRRAMRNRWTFAQFDKAVLFHIDAGCIRGMCDIKDNRDGWADTVRGHLGSTATDFLLHGVDRIGGGVWAFFVRVQVGENVCKDEPTDPVVQGAPDDEAVGKFHRVIDENGWSSDTEAQFFDILCRRSANIDKELLPLGWFVLGSVAQVNRSVSNNPLNDSLRSKEPNPPGRRQRAVGAADGADCEKPVLIDMPDNKSDLIRMSFQHDPRSLGVRALQHGPSVSVGIRLHTVRMRSHIFHPKALAFFFPS